MNYCDDIVINARGYTMDTRDSHFKLNTSYPRVLNLRRYNEKTSIN